MANLSVKIHKLNFKNPVTTASGTFGFGEEYNDFIDVNRLGGIFVKGLTLETEKVTPTLAWLKHHQEC